MMNVVPRPQLASPHSISQLSRSMFWLVVPNGHKYRNLLVFPLKRPVTLAVFISQHCKCLHENSKSFLSRHAVRPIGTRYRVRCGPPPNVGNARGPRYTIINWVGIASRGIAVGSRFREDSVNHRITH